MSTTNGPIESGTNAGGDIGKATDDFEANAKAAQLASIRMANIQMVTSAITGAAKARGDLAAQMGGDLRASAKVKE